MTVPGEILCLLLLLGGYFNFGIQPVAVGEWLGPVTNNETGNTFQCEDVGRTSREKAKEMCTSRGSGWTLASVLSESDNIFLKDLLEQCTSGNAWFGLTWNASAGEEQWDDGSPVNFSLTNIAGYRPGKTCACIQKASPPRWLPEYCRDDSHETLCSKTVGSTPTTAVNTTASIRAITTALNPKPTTTGQASASPNPAPTTTGQASDGSTTRTAVTAEEPAQATTAGPEPRGSTAGKWYEKTREICTDGPSSAPLGTAPTESVLKCAIVCATRAGCASFRFLDGMCSTDSQRESYCWSEI